MFKLAHPDTLYSHPVELSVPKGGGKTEKMAFTAKFKLVSADVFQKAAQDDLEFARTVLFGWDDIADHEGKPLPFNDSNRDMLARISYFSYGLAKAYTEFASGQPVKNLSKRRVN